MNIQDEMEILNKRSVESGNSDFLRKIKSYPESSDLRPHFTATNIAQFLTAPNFSQKSAEKRKKVKFSGVERGGRSEE